MWVRVAGIYEVKLVPLCRGSDTKLGVGSLYQHVGLTGQEEEGCGEEGAAGGRRPDWGGEEGRMKVAYCDSSLTTQDGSWSPAWLPSLL